MLLIIMAGKSRGKMHSRGQACISWRMDLTKQRESAATICPRHCSIDYCRNEFQLQSVDFTTCRICNSQSAPSYICQTNTSTSNTAAILRVQDTVIRLPASPRQASTRLQHLSDGQPKRKRPACAQRHCSS